MCCFGLPVLLLPLFSCFLPEGCIGVVHGSFEQEDHGVAVFSIDSGKHVFDALAHHNLSDTYLSVFSKM